MKASNGDDSANQKVPTVVPRGAEYGAIRLTSKPLRIASVCTEEAPQGRKRTGQKNAKSPGKPGLFALLCIALHRFASVAEPGLEPGRESPPTGF